MPLLTSVILTQARWGGDFPDPNHAEPKRRILSSLLGSGRFFFKEHFFHGDIAWDVLKKSIFFRNPYDVLESRLLALSANIAVDSPKHCKGCKKHENFRMPGAISIFFLDFATLTRFWRGASGHENSLLE